MRLVALVKSPDHVCTRYRLAAFAPILQESGHALDLLTWSGWSFLAGAFRRRLREADAVIVQRRLPSWWQLRLLRSCARRLIFDFDDAVFQSNSYRRRKWQSGGRGRRFRAMLGAADIVTAGNDWLADQAARWTTSANVLVVPTCVNVESYWPARHDADQDIRLAWIGSSSTLRGLKQWAAHLDQEKISGISLRIICDRTLELQNMPVEFRPWTLEQEAADLAECDIGISWLPDDDWSRGKCGLKLLQYMAAGLPVVANPVGMHRELVEDGENGILADTPEQWRSAIRLLADQPELRRRMGLAGRERVRREFDVAQGGALWLSLLRTESASEIRNLRLSRAVATALNRLGLAASTGPSAPTGVAFSSTTLD